jgi:glucose-6-phosphate-specific signal transduction histidine kinase
MQISLGAQFDVALSVVSSAHMCVRCTQFLVLSLTQAQLLYDASFDAPLARLVLLCSLFLIFLHVSWSGLLLSCILNSCIIFIDLQ